MKLTDITPTPAASAHTAKLKHQVHKATVAAAKAPRLDLGVIGISIGQTQSTGDTSKTGTPHTKHIAEQVSGQDAVDMLKEFGQTFGMLFRLADNQGTVVDEAAVVDEAITLYSMIKQHNSVYNDISKNYINGLRTQLNGTVTTFERLNDHSNALEDIGYNPPKWIAEVFSAAGLIADRQKRVLAHMNALDRVLSYIHYIDVVVPKEENEKMRTFGRAVLKQLGIV